MLSQVDVIVWVWRGGQPKLSHNRARIHRSLRCWRHAL